MALCAKKQRSEDNDLLCDMLRQHGGCLGGHDSYLEYQMNLNERESVVPSKSSKPSKPKGGVTESENKKYDADLELFQCCRRSTSTIPRT